MVLSGILKFTGLKSLCDQSVKLVSLVKTFNRWYTIPQFAFVPLMNKWIVWPFDTAMLTF